MPAKKFIPIEIKTNTPENIFQDNKLELSKTIIDAIAFAIKYKRKRVDFALIIVKGLLVITLSIDSKEFVDLLEQNIENLIEFEEYEHCALASKLKSKIQKNELQLQVQESGSSKTN